MKWQFIVLFCISLLSFYQLGLGLGTDKRHLGLKFIAHVKVLRWSVQTWHGSSTPQCQSPKLLLLLLCCVWSLFPRSPHSPRWLLEPQPSCPIFQPQEERRDKGKGDNECLPAVFSGRFLESATSPWPELGHMGSPRWEAEECLYSR